MNVISAAIEPVQAGGKRGEGAELGLLADNLTYGTGDTLKAFGVAVLLVLLIACANVSNLLLGQAVRRRKEIAIRSALGASRARLVRQFLIETMVLAVSGGGAGVLLAMWGMPLLMAIVPVESAFGVLLAMGGIGLDWTVLGFAVAASLIAALLAGLLPALRASRPAGGAPFLASRSIPYERVRGILIGAEVALSLVLLTGAGLLIKSVVRLLAVNPGFDTRNLLTVDVELPKNKYPEVRQRAEFVRSAVQRLQQIPGVTVAAAINVMPLTKSSVTNGFTLLGPSRQSGSAGFRAVTPDYFETMGIPLIRGRLPARGEIDVAVVNQAMVRRFSPDREPLDQEIEAPRIERVRTAQGWTMRISPEHFRIIGVVGDVRHLSLAYDPEPEMFLPYSQMATAVLTFVVRSRVARDTLAPAARRAILAVDPDQPVGEIRSLDEIISTDLSGRHFVLMLLCLFAIVALALAGAGIFAVVSHSVSQRTREIGIRMALGANAASVITAVVRQTFVWVTAGLVIGCAGSLAASRALRAYLFRVDPGDPLVLAAAVMLAAIAGCAAFVPARAAARVDPAVTLRCE
jgi:putative ABC transport system permease protein